MFFDYIPVCILYIILRCRYSYILYILGIYYYYYDMHPRRLRVYNTGNGSAVGDNRAMRIVQNNGNRLVNSAFNPVRRRRWRRWRFLWPAAQGRTQTQNIASTAAEGLRVFVATLHIIIITRTHALHIYYYHDTCVLVVLDRVTILQYILYLYMYNIVARSYVCSSAAHTHTLARWPSRLPFFVGSPRCSVYPATHCARLHT